MQLRPTKLHLAVRPCATRLPFRFGISTMTEADMLIVSVEVESDSGRHTGHSGELMVPKWFEKNPSATIEEDNAALVRSVRAAFDAAKEGGDGTVFELWLRAQERCVETSAGEIPRLVSMFGVALVERALMDAACRSTHSSFDSALASDIFGLDFGRIEPRLSDWTGSALGTPLDSVRVRHTVGLVDALEPDEVPDELRMDDDHPVSLVDDIAAYGLDCFKLKLSGHDESDLRRLETIDRLTPNGAAFTVDGNEQYRDPSVLADVLDELESRGTAPGILSGLLAIEQPVARARTFDPAATDGIARLSERAPVIIDEADADLSSYPRAKELGYGGVSMKACKGVCRALLNRARIEADGTGLQTAEDLTNLPVLPLHQDLAVVRAMGLPHVERNGHHYFRGQSHLSKAERQHLLEHHGSLYRAVPRDDGASEGRLAIESGRLDLSSLKAAGFGYGGPIDEAMGRTLN